MGSGNWKRRTTVYEGEELVFFCSDEELEEFMTPKTLDALWWRKQSDEFKSEWIDASCGMKTEEEIHALKREMYAAREIERRAGVNFSRPHANYREPI